MLNIEKFITKDGSKFYLDLEEFKNQNEIEIENGDIFKFNYEQKKYIGKIIDGKNSVVEVSIVKELTQ